MSKLTVEDTSLVSVANAIRTKGGTTDQLVFPDGFVSAIEGIQSGDGGAFASLVDKSITEVTADMLKGCTKIGRYAFYYCTSLASVNIPSNVTSIGSYAFCNCIFTNITIPDSVTSLEFHAFDSCSKLVSIKLSNNITSLEDYTFSGCTKLTDITFPNNLTSFQNYVFSGSGIVNITIPDSVTSIGYGVFTRCTKLTDITIPKNVTSMESSVFSNCSALTTVTMKPTKPPKLGTSVFNGCDALTQIIVPAGTLSAYKSATNWSKYARYMVEATS